MKDINVVVTNVATGVVTGSLAGQIAAGAHPVTIGILGSLAMFSFLFALATIIKDATSK